VKPRKNPAILIYFQLLCCSVEN